MSGAISDQSWPKYEGKYLISDTMKIAVQINGKTRGIIELEVNMKKGDICNHILSNDTFKKYFDSGKIIKEIYVPNKLVNFVLK